jgi:hypothetical protein
MAAAAEVGVQEREVQLNYWLEHSKVRRCISVTILIHAALRGWPDGPAVGG